ncbi:hypothetical protein RB195_000854 [Necator americanus]|uniref:EGF-like domain-containing protein n=1 Tax=Necator americanus TaxID=51031 RepID=A0ABR1DC50_NECAM
MKKSTTDFSPPGYAPQLRSRNGQGQKKEDTLTNIHNNFDKFAKKCNVYDEAHYCHQIVVDQRLNLAAISYKCECPDGWRCPSGIADTRFVTECQFDESKHWHRCQLRCTPVNAE